MLAEDWAQTMWRAAVARLPALVVGRLPGLAADARRSQCRTPGSWFAPSCWSDYCRWPSPCRCFRPETVATVSYEPPSSRFLSQRRW